MKKQMQNMKNGSQQLALEEVSMMPQQQIHQESKTHHSTKAPSMQTQLPKQKTVKGLQQQTLKEESKKMMQTECEARRRMSRTKQSREKPQLLQQDCQRSRRFRAKEVTAGETEASAVANTKNMKGLQQTCSKETNKETGEKEAGNEQAKEESESIPEFTEQEVQAAIDNLKKRNIWRH